jgi:dTDP-4-amino-4,6-dideoxygalactose transaminase
MARLAINGGPAVAPPGLRTIWPVFGDAEREAVLRALGSGIWCRLGATAETGEVSQFEAEFARWHGAAHCVAVTNGTAAIQCALAAVGLEAGDEVITTPITFISTALAIVLENGAPVFADIDPETYQIDPAAVEAAVTPRTRAILPVHYAGYPCDMDRLTAIAHRHGIALVEDCAHAHGSEWRSQKVGTFGDAGAFSFQASKTLNCGEGGALITNDEELAAKAFSYHHIGRVPGRPFYEHHAAAPNFRMTELQGALLRAQLTRLSEQTAVRQQNGERLAAGLEQIEGVSALPREERITQRGYYFFVICYDSERFGGVPRDRFLEALRAEGVAAGTGYGLPVHKNPVFQSPGPGRTGSVNCHHWAKDTDYTHLTLPAAERVMAEEQVALENNHLLSAENVEVILAAVAKIRENVDELRVTP